MEALEWNNIVKKYFVELMDIVKGGVNLASEQVPLYLKELITYEFWHSILWGSMFLVLNIASIWILKKFYKRFKANSYNHNGDPVGWGFAMVIVIIFIGVFGIQSLTNFDNAIKAKVAPRVLVVEKIQRLVNAPKSCNH